MLLSCPQLLNITIQSASASGKNEALSLSVCREVGSFHRWMHYKVEKEEEVYLH